MSWKAAKKASEEEAPEGMFVQTKFDSMIIKEKHEAMPATEPGMYIPRPARVLKTRLSVRLSGGRILP